MNTTGNHDHAKRRSPLGQREFHGVMPRRLEFEEFDDFAADTGHVVRMIERGGSVAPEFASFGLD